MSNEVIASISISGEITLNLHSLNNEGGEGNQIITRQVTIVDKEGQTHTVNAISGDMFKHIHAAHLINKASENSNELSLCEGCKIADPNRISLDSSFLSVLKGIDPEEFDEEDKSEYLLAKTVLDTDDEGSSKEAKDALKKMKEIEKKYIVLKIKDNSDKNKYLVSQTFSTLKLKKGKPLDDDDFKIVKEYSSEAENSYEAIKKLQDEAKKLMKEIAKKYNLDFSSAEKIDKLIETCIVDDVHGNLITAEKNNLPRKSVIEFGWTIGLPNKNNSESYIHTKLVADAGEKGSGNGSNTGQNIFHRPANHGVYAFVCSIDVYRIGFNDINRRYPDDVDRAKRYKAVIQSLLSSFINPKGAMTSVQKPHITDFKGVVTTSSKLTPAPTISAINEDYRSEIEKIAASINKIECDAITVKEFNGLGELSEILSELIKAEPYKIQ